MSVDRDNVIQAFGWFKDLMDADNDAKLAGLSYTLPAATEYDLGGVKVGDGLEMDADDRLNVTISGGDTNVIEAITVDGTIQPVTNKTAALNLSAFAKKTDVANALSSISSLSLAINSLKVGDTNVIEAIAVDGTIQPPDASKTVNLNLGLSSFAKKTEVASGVRMKGSVDFFSNLANLPEPPAVGDLYNIKSAGGYDGDGTPILAGDNVVYTDKGTWDVMAGFIDTSRFVEKVAGKQLSTNDFTNADKAKLAGLSNYTLPTASKTVKGGVKVGDGLKMDGDTLSVTLQSGDKYDAFEGATANFAGTSGLVPSPAGGDNTKFLRGDGTWAPATQNITVYSAAVTVPTNPQAFDGALWEDSLGNGDPCLKMRYGDYEFNFKYDTKNYTGKTQIFTPEDAQLYMLDTVPSTDEGTLWYNVTQSTYFPIPALCLHAGSFDYGYNYDTITYKGNKDGLYSYLPLQNTISDAMGKTWTTTRTDFSYVKLSNGVTALSNQTSVATSHKSGLVHSFSSPLSTFTIDFWFSWTSAGLTYASGIFVSILNLYGDSFGVQASQSSGGTALKGIGVNGYGNLSAQNDKSSAYIILTKDEITNHSTRRVHLAMEHAGSGAAVVYLNGKRVATTPAFSSISEIALMQYCQKTGSSSKPMYIDHFRVWNKVVWDGDFEVPKLSDY